MKILIKRAYDEPDTRDGYRVLVDRIWPRGVTKEKAAIDYWDKDAAPSTELRKWFSHDPAKWDEFKRRYYRELDGSNAARELLDRIGVNKTVTLVYSARDTEHNQALALQEYLGNITS